MPTIIAIIWNLSIFAFIITFQHIPTKSNPDEKFFNRIRIRIRRAGYWAISIVFAATTLSVVYVSYNLIKVWLKDYM